ncbi:MAG TPA: DUF4389 domain-containing protein [Vicinamibacterales bacterium]|nr:DUF4389 domain-containing protein [Vicinamibacterales bacterium]
MPYPVTVAIEPLVVGRNRLTTAFRLILAIPHLILVGGIGFTVAAGSGSRGTAYGGDTGLLGAVAWFLAIVSWFTIVFAGHHIIGIRQFTLYYMRWRVRALAYLMLLEDQYPPFGDAAYPASLTIEDPAGQRNRLTVLVRIFLGIPHLIVLVFLIIAWWLTAVVAWLLILVTGEYPRGLYDFGVGVLRWLLRVQAYMLLMVDEYPPFSLN